MARKAKRKRRKLILDCEICGVAMCLPPARYLALVAAGRRPRCRRNGCQRLLGAGERSGDAKTPGTARKAEILMATKVRGFLVSRRRFPAGRRNGALEKLAVKPDDTWRYEGCPDKG